MKFTFQKNYLNYLPKNKSHLVWQVAQPGDLFVVFFQVIWKVCAFCAWLSSYNGEIVFISCAHEQP